MLQHICHVAGISHTIIRNDKDVASILQDERIENDVEEYDMEDWNDELQDDCENDYIGEHDDYSEDDRSEHNNIPDCNHADDSIGHDTTIVLEEVQCNDYATTVELKDVEAVKPIYDNPIALENDIHLLDDSDQETVNTRVSHQWIIPRVDMISFQIVATEESNSMEDHLYHEKVFPSKVKLKRALSMLALKEHFEIRVKKSCHARLEIGCKEKARNFALHATKLLEGEYWRVQTLQKVHTCTVDSLQCGYQTASARLIDELFSTRLQGNYVTPLRPKEIMEEMNHMWGLQCLYGKAWYAKKYAESLVFGPLKESCQLLTSYFHMLERENPGTITVVVADGEQRLKYYFWTFRSCIGGFSAVMLLVVAINAIHLKGRFKGILFVMHLGIKNAVEKMYNDARHSLCNYVKNKFKREDVATIFTLAANYDKLTNFNKHMNQLK
ncbi:Uncharacterized protein TCM_032881 [Theobroma cacao]|uniref:Uncharacterized protein n=1 Tax=Theobroma cacao TaxID=3641 RepID=A0A061FB36_THECC|nr:Uncharacterized protein TCM_032881 [Theobroma cacao]